MLPEGLVFKIELWMDHGTPPQKDVYVSIELAAGKYYPKPNLCLLTAGLD
ncbi:hypothetical protein N9093_01070 [bacterium]|nr:hypothetical protein [bacterium]